MPAAVAACWRVCSRKGTSLQLDDDAAAAIFCCCELNGSPVLLHIIAADDAIPFPAPLCPRHQSPSPHPIPARCLGAPEGLCDAPAQLRA